MNYKKLLLIFLITGTIKLFSQPFSSQNVYFVGHSLVNLNMPAMFKSIALSGGKTHTYDYQIGNGANLWYQYDTNLGNEQGLPYQNALPTGNYDAFVFTEAVPLKGHLQYSHTYNFADSFAIMALAARLDIRMFVYETWHCTNSGTTGCQYDPESTIAWRQRLTNDLHLWEGIADSINNRRSPQHPVHVLPAGQGMAMLYDSVLAGKVPGYTQMTQFFTDDIHLTINGNYFIACVMYATIYGETPEGLTNKTKDEWGGSFADVPTALALKLQQIAWKAVCSYVPLGYNCSTPTGITNDKKSEVDWSVYMNNSFLTVNTSINGELQVFNPSGQLVYTVNKTSEQNTINTGEWAKGIYLVRFVNSDRSIIKKIFIE